MIRVNYLKKAYFLPRKQLFNVDRNYFEVKKRLNTGKFTEIKYFLIKKYLTNIYVKYSNKLF